MDRARHLLRHSARLLAALGRVRRRVVASSIARHLRKRAAGSRLVVHEWLAVEDQERWRMGAAQRGRLTIVAVTYRQVEPLACFLASLNCQTLLSFDLLLLHDGPDPATPRLVEDFSTRARFPLHYVETPDRFNDWGHSLRALGLEQATGEYVAITNADNYYGPRWVEFALAAADLDQADVVMWNMVHSHRNVGRMRGASYRVLDVWPLRQHVDIGALMVRTTLARRAGFRDRSHDADASYLEDVVAAADAGLRVSKLDKVLMVHN